MVKLKKTFLLYLIIIGLSFGILASDARARQAIDEVWEPTIVIGGEDAHAMWPIVAADPYGRVHVFWAQPYGDGQPGIEAIMHRMKDVNGWENATDIFMRDSWAYSYPNAAFSVDKAYLIWAEWTGLYFSFAPLDQVGNPRAWIGKQIIASQSGITQSRIMVAPDGGVHVVYSRLTGSLGGDGNVYYLQSLDNGHTWSEPLVLSNVPDAVDYDSFGVRIAIDQANIIHVVWEETRSPSWIGRIIYYTRRLPDSAIWENPIVLSNPNPNNTFWEEAPSIVVDSNGDVHLVWVCGVVTNRCYRYSLDNGENWSLTERILGNFESLAGWDDFFADADGGIHLVAQLRSPENVYHAQKFQGNDWGMPFPAYTLAEAAQAHYISAALTQGNLLHVVSTSDSGGVIWYGVGSLPISAIPARPMQTGTTRNIEG